MKVIYMKKFWIFLLNHSLIRHFTGSVHRNIGIQEVIKCIVIDKENINIYLKTTKEAMHYSINTNKIEKLSKKEPVIIISPLQLHLEDRYRTYIIRY